MTQLIFTLVSLDFSLFLTSGWLKTLGAGVRPILGPDPVAITGNEQVI